MTFHTGCETLLIPLCMCRPAAGRLQALEKQLVGLKKKQKDLTQQWESERGDMLRLQVFSEFQLYLKLVVVLEIVYPASPVTFPSGACWLCLACTTLCCTLAGALCTLCSRLRRVWPVRHFCSVLMLGRWCPQVACRTCLN